MTNKKIIYIEDEQESIDIYKLSLARIYPTGFEIIALMPTADIRSMIVELQKQSNVVSYVVDERLSHTGIATYSGSELIKEIRNLDPKIPIYILTSIGSEISNTIGDIEFVIDKNDLSDATVRNELAKRLLRHIDTFEDIKSNRAIRLDCLLRKSIEETLTDIEQAEFNELNFSRTKLILLEEQGDAIALKIQLDRQEALLKEIEERLQSMGEM